MEQDVIERDAGDSKQINITINLKCICSQCHEKKEKEVVVKEEIVVKEVEEEKKEESAREKWLKREEKALKDALVKPEELVKHRKSIVPRFLRSIKRKSLTLLEDDIKKNEERALKSAMRSRSPSPSRKTVNFDVDTAAVKDEMQRVTASYSEDKDCIKMEYCNDLHIHEEERRSESESDLITIESLIPQLLQHPLPSELLSTLRQYIESKYYLQENKRHEEVEKETHRPLFKRSKLVPIFKAAAAGLKLATIAL